MKDEEIIEKIEKANRGFYGPSGFLLTHEEAIQMILDYLGVNVVRQPIHLEKKG